MRWDRHQRRILQHDRMTLIPCSPERYRTIWHAKVACYWSLSTHHLGRFGFWTCWTTEQAYCQHTIDVLDRPGELLDFPHTIHSVAFLSVREVRSGEQGMREGCVNDKKVLVCLDGSSFDNGTLTNERTDSRRPTASQRSQPLHDLSRRLGFDFYWNGGPLGE